MMRLWRKFQGKPECLPAPINEAQAQQIAESSERVSGNTDRKEAASALKSKRKQAVETGKTLRQETRELSHLLKGLLEQVRPGEPDAL